MSGGCEGGEGMGGNGCIYVLVMVVSEVGSVLICLIGGCWGCCSLSVW